VSLSVTEQPAADTVPKHTTVFRVGRIRLEECTDRVPTVLLTRFSVFVELPPDRFKVWVSTVCYRRAVWFRPATRFVTRYIRFWRFIQLIRLRSITRFISRNMRFIAVSGATRTIRFVGSIRFVVFAFICWRNSNRANCRFPGRAVIDGKIAIYIISKDVQDIAIIVFNVAAFNPVIIRETGIRVIIGSSGHWSGRRSR